MTKARALWPCKQVTSDRRGMSDIIMWCGVLRSFSLKEFYCSVLHTVVKKVFNADIPLPMQQDTAVHPTAMYILFIKPLTTPMHIDTLACTCKDMHNLACKPKICALYRIWIFNNLYFCMWFISFLVRVRRFSPLDIPDLEISDIKRGSPNYAKCSTFNGQQRETSINLRFTQISSIVMI